MRLFCAAAAMGALFLAMAALSVSAAYMEPIDQFKDAEPLEGLAVVRVSLSFEPSGGHTGDTRSPDVTVILCKTATKKHISAVRKTGNILAGQIGPYRALFSDIEFMAGRAREHRISDTVSDNGTFVIKNVPPEGSYFVYGAYRNDSTAGYWLLPVTVTEAKTYEITLTEKNAKEIYHRGGREQQK